jgi:alpha/beta superfamily hydrolase
VSESTSSPVRALWIEGPAGRLEARVRVANAPRAAALVAHPHPLHGGTLHNPVIFHSERELHRLGLTTMRFNFRGVGDSDGEHDAGRGEVDDVAAAASWVRGIAPGVPLLVVGYSFGSWCGVRYAVDDSAVAGVIAVGLPARLYPFDEVERLGRPLAAVHGTRDEFGSPDEVRAILDRATPPGQLHLVEGAQHLFPGQAPAAAAEVARAASHILQSTTSPSG